MSLVENCSKYVAYLRSLYLIHQTHHWLVAGKNFYGNHLLFERIYKSAADNADSAAEKMIGLFGSDALNPKTQADFIHDFLKKYTQNDISVEALLESSIKAEQDFISLSKEFYQSLNESEDMTLGLDDLIMSVCNERETSLYLLKQAYNGDKKMSKLNELANKFRVKLAQMGPAMSPDNNRLQEIADRVKIEFAESLGLSASMNDIKLDELKLVTKPDGKPAISWKLSVSPTIAKQYNDAVMKLKQTNPSFQPTNLVAQIINKYMPNIELLPAQPISVG